jgi:pimeloyl-ACP methyl ester carboxylesterase
VTNHAPATAATNNTYRDVTVVANGITFTYREAGEGPLLLLLHGFPDNATTWNPHLEAFAAAGYHAVAPFLRGCPPTSIPADGRYDMVSLGTDVAALVAALGEKTAFVVGHDFGAVATFAATALYPEVITAAVVMSVAHPAHFLGIIENPELLHRNFDYWLLLAPGFGPACLAANDLSLVDYLWKLWSPGHDDRAHIETVKRETLRQPGAVDAMIDYYRDLLTAKYDSPSAVRLFEPNQVPTLSLWGANDSMTTLADGEASMFTAAYRREVIPAAGHFIHREQPDQVTRLADEWFQSSGVAGRWQIASRA